MTPEKLQAMKNKHKINKEKGLVRDPSESIEYVALSQKIRNLSHKEVVDYIYNVGKVVERLENYPTCMSCYLSFEEHRAATDLKNKFIEILKEELL